MPFGTASNFETNVQAILEKYVQDASFSLIPLGKFKVSKKLYKKRKC
jgi:hypothetical protein